SARASNYACQSTPLPSGSSSHAVTRHRPPAPSPLPSSSHFSSASAGSSSFVTAVVPPSFANPVHAGIDLPQSVSGVPASSMSQPEDQPAVVGAHVQQLPPQTNSTPVPFLNAQLGNDGCLRKEWIDHRLAPYYATVLNLPSVLLHPVGDNPSSDFDDFLTVDQLLHGHSQHVQDSILACLNFRMAGAFFNGSREAPHQWLCTQTLKDGKQCSVLKHRHQRQLVKTVYVMVGAIKNCNIYAPIPFPSCDGFPRLIRTVDIIAVLQEAQTLAAHFGDPNPASVAKATVALPTSRGGPSPMTADDSSLKLFPHFYDPVPFSHTIPIFDGRGVNGLPPFTAQNWEMSRIGQRSYPLYLGGNHDVPPGSKVMVGFTTQMWFPKSSPSDPQKGLSFSVQFLVLLALPPTSSSDGPKLAAGTNNNTASSTSSFDPLARDDVVYHEDLYP
ncbi:hypothetical protein EV360DRAFT_89118, partial [Lentinula raphanica]